MAFLENLNFIIWHTVYFLFRTLWTTRRSCKSNCVFGFFRCFFHMWSNISCWWRPKYYMSELKYRKSRLEITVDVDFYFQTSVLTSFWSDSKNSKRIGTHRPSQVLNQIFWTCFVHSGPFFRGLGRWFIRSRIIIIIIFFFSNLHPDPILSRIL